MIGRAAIVPTHAQPLVILLALCLAALHHQSRPTIVNVASPLLSSRSFSHHQSAPVGGATPTNLVFSALLLVHSGTLATGWAEGLLVAGLGVAVGQRWRRIDHHAAS